jgi:hypothetical protein
MRLFQWKIPKLCKWDVDLEARFTSPNFTIIILGMVNQNDLSYLTWITTVFELNDKK